MNRRQKWGHNMLLPRHIKKRERTYYQKKRKRKEKRENKKN